MIQFKKPNREEYGNVRNICQVHIKDRGVVKQCLVMLSRRDIDAILERGLLLRPILYSCIINWLPGCVYQQ